MFCSKCGKQLNDGAKFCSSCGNPVKTVKTAAQQEVVKKPAAEASVGCSVPAGKKIRVRCASCGRVDDYMELVPCPKCGTKPADGGYLKLYRMGSPYGVASGFGIYVDTLPDGYIGNKQTCWVWLPYGTHKIHVAVGMNRKCQDLSVTISPEAPVQGARVYLKPNFWVNQFVLEAYDPAAIPD